MVARRCAVVVTKARRLCQETASFWGPGEGDPTGGRRPGHLAASPSFHGYISSQGAMPSRPGMLQLLVLSLGEVTSLRVGCGRARILPAASSRATRSARHGAEPVLSPVEQKTPCAYTLSKSLRTLLKQMTRELKPHTLLDAVNAHAQSIRPNQTRERERQ